MNRIYQTSMARAYKILALAHIVAGAAFLGTSLAPTLVVNYFVFGMIFSLVGLLCWKIVGQIEQQTQTKKGAE